MDHTQMEWSDSESENTEDRDFIDNSTVVTSTITQNTRLDDDPSTLISEMDAETKRIYLQKMNDSSTVRRSTRKRKRPKTWFETHTDDFKVYLEDTTVNDLVESSEQDTTESETESYQPSISSTDSDNSDNSDTESN